MKTIFLLVMGAFALTMQALDYEIQLENEQVCVAIATIFPHEEIALHRDIYPQVVFALKGGTIRRLEANGTTTDVEFPTEVAVFRQADPVDELHRSVNLSCEEIKLLIVQLKSK